ncbi:MAG: TraB/GumN family protein [Methylobacteriaceae bacterium]|nr:TraB/GumN family protein [Methylobacteriaceae bacterium]
MIVRFALAIGLILAAGSGTPVVAQAPTDNAPPTCGGKNLIEDARSTNSPLYRAALAQAKDVPNGEGLLWKVEKAGAAPSYLFGTMATTDERAVAMARSMAKYIEGMPTVATELGDFSDPELKAGLAKNLARRVAADTTETAALVGSAEDLEHMGEVLKGYGLDSRALRLPPWRLVDLFWIPVCEYQRSKRGLPSTDQVIVDLGKAARARIVGLEGWDEEADALQAVNPKILARVLVHRARRPGLIEDLFATGLALYLEQHVGLDHNLAQVVAEVDARDFKAYDILRSMVVENRNFVLWRHAKPLVGAGGVFLAVSALNIVGKYGLIELMRADGYSVTRVQ